jgi:phospholipase/carboxylesterase
MTATPVLDDIVIEPQGEAKATIIWMHGLGANGHDFAPFVPMLGLPPELGVRFIFPNAPMRPITINMGNTMPGWFDILSLEPEGPQDHKGIEESSHRINALIKQEIAKGIPSEKILLAGFSQGGCMALHVGLHYPEKLAGILALSTFLPLHSQFGQRLSPANRDIEIWQGHGNLDEVVHFDFGKYTKQLLEAENYKVLWNTYPVAHTVSPIEAMDFAQWMKQKLA